LQLSLLLQQIRDKLHILVSGLDQDTKPFLLAACLLRKSAMLSSSRHELLLQTKDFLVQFRPVSLLFHLLPLELGDSVDGFSDCLLPDALLCLQVIDPA
jgi:hypothetical protein